MTVKGIFFDFYGTLCVLDNMADELDEWITELGAQLRKYGSVASKPDVLDYFNRRMRKENPPKPDDGMTIFERRIQIAGSDLEGARIREKANQYLNTD